MPHVNIYVPKELEEDLRKEAKTKKLSLSAYFVDLVRRQKKSNEWNKDFLTKALGGWKGDFPDILRDFPQHVAPL